MIEGCDPDEIAGYICIVAINLDDGNQKVGLNTDIRNKTAAVRMLNASMTIVLTDVTHGYWSD